jgi:hypothetical protein
MSVVTLNNMMASKNSILEGESYKPSSKKFETSKYEKIETILLEWFCKQVGCGYHHNRSSVTTESCFTLLILGYSKLWRAG